MISWDWADGFLAAVRNIEQLSQAAAADSATRAAWISAVGSIIAGGAAAIAAWLSWSISKNAGKASVESEKVALFKELVQLQDVSSVLATKIIRTYDCLSALPQILNAGLPESLTEHYSRIGKISGDFHEMTKGIGDLLARIREVRSATDVRERYEELIGLKAKLLLWEFELRKVEAFLESREAKPR